MVASSVELDQVPILDVPAACITKLHRVGASPDWPGEEAHLQGADATTTFHLRAFNGDDLMGCAMVLLKPLAGVPRPAYRLRGMPVLEKYRSHGIRGRLLAALGDGVRAPGREVPCEPNLSMSVDLISVECIRARGRLLCLSLARQLQVADL
ncbi:MAG: hypothetical protein KGR26_01185 [Cyanobacteria bacterium REEB65]|nr:hypothetical protein [Cyanobacteria bacterium REEB65]